MLLNEFTSSLNEARYRKPILVYHGTSDKNLRNIMVNGVEPFPLNKVWDDDKMASLYGFTRKSIGGSYWTSDFMIAYASSGRAIQKLGGEYRVIVCAMINEQSAYADEDSLDLDIKNALTAMLKVIGVSPAMDYVWMLGEYFFGIDKNDKLIHDAVEIFRNELSSRAKSEYILPFDKAKEIAEAFIMRSIIFGGTLRRPSFELPSRAEIEQRCWEIRGALTRTYRSSAFRGDYHGGHTMRTELPIGFSGNNKITCVFAIDRTLGKLYVHYGELPSDVEKAYETSIGPIRGIEKI